MHLPLNILCQENTEGKQKYVVVYTHLSSLFFSHRLLNSSADQTDSGIAEVYGVLASSESAKEGSLQKKEEEDAVTGQAGWIQGRRERDIISANDKYSSLSYPGENDSFDYSIHRNAGSQGVSTTRRPETDNSPGEDVLDGDGGVALSTQASYGEEGRMGSKEDNLEAGEETFMRFRGDSSKKSLMTAVCFLKNCSFFCL